MSTEVVLDAPVAAASAQTDAQSDDLDERSFVIRRHRRRELVSKVGRSSYRVVVPLQSFESVESVNKDVDVLRKAGKIAVYAAQ